MEELSKIQEQPKISKIFNGRFSMNIKFLVFSVFCVSLYFALFTESENRTYWPFMIASYALACLVYFSTNQGGLEHTKKDKPLNFLFSPKLWFHRSSIQDYYMITINHFLVATAFQYIIIQPSDFVEFLKPFLAYIQISQIASPPSALIVTIFFFSVFLASDIMYFFGHRLMHQFPSLWEFHKVHHSAEVMTPLTVLRAHPVELWLLTSLRVLGQGIVSALFLYIYPNMQTFGIVTLVNGVVFFINVTLANLRHSHVWISYGPVIEKLFLSPAQHQIHHSIQRKHYDKNFGSSLAIWDWVFNSLYITKKHEEVVFGLGKERETAKLNTIWDLYWTPFVRSFKILFKSKR